MKLHHFVLPMVLLTSTAFTQTNLIQNSGNIGIGTTTPEAELHVIGRPIFQGGQSAIVHRNSYGDTVALTGVRNDVAGESNFTFHGYGANWIFYNGNVGIGTVSPTEKLVVAGNVVAYDFTADQGRFTSSVTSNEGGHLRLVNPSKMGPTTNNWTIYNMTGPYNNGLAFWRYYADGTNPGPSVFFHDNGNVGIGTNNPNYKLEVSAGDTRNIYFDVSGSPKIGTTYGTGGSVELYNSATGAMTFTTSAASYPFVFSTGNVGIGTTNPQHKLAVNGTIKAKEIIVETTGWSDYVFADDYRLAPLSEVESHIAEKKHLPGMPSAAEVTENGVNVAQIQAALLAKVEELTLHLIAQEKSLRELKAENETLKTRMATYEQR